MTHNIFVYLIIIFIAGSCGKTSNQDSSLTPNEYKKFGLPDNASVWGFEDYKSACTALDEIKFSQPLSLPKKNSNKSGIYFDRIINPENLDFTLDEAIPLKQRALKIQSYTSIHSYLIKIYTDLENTDQYYNKELIDLYIFGIIIMQNMLDLGYQINESTDTDNIEMQSGFQSIKYRYVKMILFILKNQQNSSLFEEYDLVRLSDFLSGSILLNKDWMEESAKKELKKQLLVVIDGNSSNHIVEKYNHLLEKL